VAFTRTRHVHQHLDSPPSAARHQRDAKGGSSRDACELSYNPKRMPINPEFNRILGTLTDQKIREFLDNQEIPEDEKRMVRNASDPLVRAKFVAGYYVRSKTKIAESEAPKTSRKKTPAKKIDTTSILARRNHTYTNGPVMRIDPKTGERIKE
jgi:hypothetical protein